MALSIQTTAKREEDTDSSHVDVQLFSDSAPSIGPDEKSTCECFAF